LLPQFSKSSNALFFPIVTAHYSVSPFVMLFAIVAVSATQKSRQPCGSGKAPYK